MFRNLPAIGPIVLAAVAGCTSENPPTRDAQLPAEMTVAPCIAAQANPPVKNARTQIVAIVAEQLGIKQERVKPEARLIEDLGADELDQIELTMALEEEFEIEIPDATAGGFLSVDDILKYIAQTVPRTPAPPPCSPNQEKRAI